MKQFWSLMLVAALSFCFVACGSSDSDDEAKYKKACEAITKCSSELAAKMNVDEAAIKVAFGATTDECVSKIKAEDSGSSEPEDAACESCVEALDAASEITCDALWACIQICQ